MSDPTDVERAADASREAFHDWWETGPLSQAQHHVVHGTRGSIAALKLQLDRLTRELPRCTEHLCHRDELLAEIDRLARELREAGEKYERWVEERERENEKALQATQARVEVEVADLRAKLDAERACHDCREYRAMMSAKLADCERDHPPEQPYLDWCAAEMPDVAEIDRLTLELREAQEHSTEADRTAVNWHREYKKAEAEVVGLRAKLAAAERAQEKHAEELKHNDPASYSSMVYWREHCYKARAEVADLRQTLMGAWGMTTIDVCAAPKHA